MIFPVWKRAIPMVLPVFVLCAASCVSNTWRKLDELSMTYTGYVQTGSYYETGEGTYERVLSGGTYEQAVPLVETKNSWHDGEYYYTVLSPADQERFVRVEKEENENVTGNYTLVEKTALLSRAEVEKQGVKKIRPPKQRKIMVPDKVFPWELVVLEEKRSLAGKVTLPLVYVDAVAVDVPLTLAGFAGSVVYGVGGLIAGWFSGESSSGEE